MRAESIWLDGAAVNRLKHFSVEQLVEVIGVGTLESRGIHGREHG